MKIYSNYPDSSFRYFFEIYYLTHDCDSVDVYEISGNSITLFFDNNHLKVTCDCTNYLFDFDNIVSFRFFDRLNTNLAEYL